MKILICGCIHGRFDIVNKYLNANEIDLCILLGDLQTFTNQIDIQSSFLPKAHSQPPLLYGKFLPNVLTICISGNHESNYMLQKIFPCGYLKNNLFYIKHGIIKIVKMGRAINIVANSGISHESSFPEQQIFKQQQLQGYYDDHFDSLVQYSCNDNCWRYLQNLHELNTGLVVTHDWPFGIEKRIQKSFKSVGGIYTKLLYQKLLLNKQNIQGFKFFAAHMHLNLKSQIEVAKIDSLDQNIFEVTNHKNSMRLNFTGLGKVEQNGYEILEFADSKTELSDGIYVKNLDNEYVKVEMRDFNVKISVGMDGQQRVQSDLITHLIELHLLNSVDTILK